MARPMYLQKRSLPDYCVVKAIDICLAAESVCGEGKVVGAQDFRGLWVIYVTDETDCEKLSTTGINLGQKNYKLLHENPYEKDGIEIPSTKLFLSNLPLSVNNDDLEEILSNSPITPRSKIFFEKIRGHDRNLTNFLSWKRFLYINIPDEPLPNKIQIGNYTCYLYYKEQPSSYFQSNAKRPENLSQRSENEETPVISQTPISQTK